MLASGDDENSNPGGTHSAGVFISPIAVSIDAPGEVPDRADGRRGRHRLHRRRQHYLEPGAFGRQIRSGPGLYRHRDPDGGYRLSVQRQSDRHRRGCELCFLRRAGRILRDLYGDVPRDGGAGADRCSGLFLAQYADRPRFADGRKHDDTQQYIAIGHDGSEIVDVSGSTTWSVTAPTPHTGISIDSAGLLSIGPSAASNLFTKTA